MASLYRLTATALLDVAPRKVASASFNRSAIQSSATLAAESFEAPAVPRIFDIFDAPVKLRERNIADGQFKALNFLSTPRATSRAGPSHSRSIYSEAVGLPRSLPPPITFDGPARPPHMSTSALKMRLHQRQSSTHSPRRLHGSSAVSFRASTSQSEPVYQLFDGPSRITRYPYPSMQNEWNYFAYAGLAVCLSSAIGWLALEDYRQRNGRSL